MFQGKFMLGWLSMLVMATATIGAQALSPRATSTSPSMAPPIPHFEVAPEISTDNGALLVRAKAAGLDDVPVGIALVATTITTCVHPGYENSDGQTIEQTLTAARPHISPENGVVEFEIRTAPIEPGCAEGMTSRVELRSSTISLYQGDQIVLEHVFNGAGHADNGVSALLRDSTRP